MRSIAVIGAGFSGIAVAVQLLRQLRQPTRVLLVNRNHRFGRGMAYGTRSASHLLNVPAGRMGLDPADDSGFVAFLQRQGLACKPHEFVARKLYGDYLEAALESAEAAAAPGVALDLVQGEVQELRPAGGRWQLRLADGRGFQADETVLALGNFAPRLPAVLSRAPGAVLADPWAPGALEGLDPADPVLLVGTGLTAFDVVLALLDRGHTGPITMLSRRGLLPQPHRALEAAPPAGLVPAEVLKGESRARMQLREVRRLVRDATAAGHDWRDVMAGLRTHTPRLWQQLDDRGRRQFVRHLLPYWDTHRHRAAPQIHGRVMEALRAGQVVHAAGRMEAAVPVTGGLELHWRPRGTCATRTSRFARAINCTGPCGDVRRSGEPLMAQAIEQGLVQPDALGLGLLVDDHYRLCKPGGEAWPSLRYVGPLLKAQRWEATAVPELRRHASELAGLLAR